MKYSVIFLLLLFSCSKLSYLVGQAQGQFKIQYEGIENKKVLADPRIDLEVKKKINLIIDTKNFFYHFFHLPPTQIYNKTTFLEREAVSYLVIASPADLIEAKEHWFPFVGSFPYLGFFDEQSAKDYAIKLHNEGFVTYIRPVFAYSTLGYFEDRILSSFFTFTDLELVDLIFHELFHTIFFQKDEIDLNENLASYFSQKLVSKYYNFTSQEKIQFENKAIKNKEFFKRLVSEVNTLKENYINRKQDSPQGILKKFLSSFLPKMKAYCLESRSDDCDEFDAFEKWNNARFAAILTYEEFQPKVESWHQCFGDDLIKYFNFLQKTSQLYKQTSKDISIIDFIDQKVKDETCFSH